MKISCVTTFYSWVTFYIYIILRLYNWIAEACSTRPLSLASSFCASLHAGARKQLQQRLLSTVLYIRMNLKWILHCIPPVPPSFITCLCLFPPCGPFSNWINWKGWRFELNNTINSHTPLQLREASKPPLRLENATVGCFFLQRHKQRNEMQIGVNPPDLLLGGDNFNYLC